MASSSHVKPGERGSITAKVNTEGRLGLVLKTVEVMTNDPSQRRVVLTLKVNVRGPQAGIVPRE
jgi:uncharacterized lipoprotein YbaY